MNQGVRQLIVTIAFILTATNGLCQEKYNSIKIGMCSDVHLPTMHDSKYRIQTFIDSMNVAKPDFIIELGDFGTPAEKYAGLFAIWDSYNGDKYHVIGNHEMDGGFSRDEAVAYRGMDNSYYSFEKNGFRFIVLDGNDPKNEDDKGYKQFIGPKQIDWLKKELAKTTFPVVIFSHQGLLKSPSTEKQPYGLENGLELQKILEHHNKRKPKQRVIACFNGHAHHDHADQVNDIWYITINSMAYKWLDEAYTEIRYSNEIDKKFKWIKYTAPYQEPLFTTVEISTKGTIHINGKQSDWVGSSPWELGYPESLKKYVRPAISKRVLNFQIPE